MSAPKILIAIFLLIICKSTFSQPLNKDERAYFILGTLSDCMGRCLDPRDMNLLDRYYAIEYPLTDAIDSLLRKDYSRTSYKIVRNQRLKGNFRSAKIFSDTLFRKFNEYYTFTPSGESTSDNDPELNNKPILRGALKRNIFNNNFEKLSFLAGAYVRFGRQNDTCYEIVVANSVSKAQTCYELLKYFQCKPFYETKQNIPVQHIVYFHPTNEVKAHMLHFMYLRRKLEKSEEEFFDMVRSGKIH